MNKNEYINIQSEVSFLEGMLSKPDLSIFSKNSIQSRLNRVKEAMASVKKITKPARAIITYRGAPVVGSKGVQAEFGANATLAFNSAISTIAASLTGALSDSGPVPNKASNQLLITGTALGSFGFVLEESNNQAQLPLEENEETPVKQALDCIVEILDATTKSDDDLSEPVSKLADRAIASIVSFLDELEKNSATCALSTNDKIFQFHDSEQIRASKSRLSSDNIHEVDKVISGSFSGVLPNKRTFEFNAINGEVINGTITKKIEHPSIINKHLNEVIEITFRARTVGSSKPRYTLSKLPWDS